MKYVFRRKALHIIAQLLDMVGGRIYPKKPSFKSAIPQNPSHFLVIRLDHLGDVLGSTSVPASLKKQYPHSKVTVLTGSLTADLFKDNPYVDNLIRFDAPWFKRGCGKKLFSFFSKNLIKELSLLGVDCALSLRGDVRENYLCHVIGARFSIGYGITGGGFWLSDCLPYPEGFHELESTRRILSFLGIENPNTSAQVYPNKTQSEIEKQNFLSSLKKGKTLGVLLNSGATSKDWSLKKWEEFFLGIQKECLFENVVWIGAATACTPLTGALHTLDLRGKTTLRQLSLLMPAFDYFVGPDSGPTHLAYSVGVPTLMLFSGTNDVSRWKPKSALCDVLMAQKPVCSPCYSHTCFTSGHPCMEDIKIEDALTIIRGVMRSRSQ